MRKLMTGAGMLSAAVLSAVATAAAAATPITYAINQTVGVGSVVGSIQTDGTIGALTDANIIAWDLHLNGDGATLEITDADSVVRTQGADVSATATQLFFDFSGADNGYFLFQQGLFSGTHYYCDASATATCFQGATVTPEAFNSPSVQNAAVSGRQVIAAVAGGAPEPAAWALMILGFGAAGAALRGRRAAAASALRQ